MSLGAVLTQLVREEWRSLPAITDQAGSPLVAMAAALNAGEPKRAMRLAAATSPAAGDEAIVSEALTTLAQTMERNWYPGGDAAMLTDDDVSVLRNAAPPGRCLHRTASAVTAVAELSAALPAWRRLVLAHAGRNHALGEAKALVRLVRDLGVAEAVR